MTVKINNYCDLKVYVYNLHTYLVGRRKQRYKIAPNVKIILIIVDLIHMYIHSSISAQQLNSIQHEHSNYCMKKQHYHNYHY